MIRRREADSRSEDASLLYRIVMRDQRLNIWFLVPAICLFNIACAIAIHTHGLFFLRDGHLILIGLLIFGLIVYLGYVIRSFVKLTPLIVAARHDWRSGEISIQRRSKLLDRRSCGTPSTSDGLDRCKVNGASSECPFCVG